MKNRKFSVFFLALLAILALAFFGKVDACGYVVTLSVGMFTANVVQKSKICDKENE